MFVPVGRIFEGKRLSEGEGNGVMIDAFGGMEIPRIEVPSLFGKVGGTHGFRIEVEGAIEGGALLALIVGRALLGVGGDFGISTDLRAVGAPMEAKKLAEGAATLGVSVGVETFENDGKLDLGMPGTLEGPEAEVRVGGSTGFATAPSAFEVEEVVGTLRSANLFL